jgi:5-methylthioadenosine/S-adenosylhomocysteine deaminase
MSLLIRNGKTLKGQGNALERADVLILQDRIAEIGLNLPAPEGAKVIDATGHLILPGLINAHTHAHNNLMKGTADNWTLEDLLNHGGALNRNRTIEDHYLSAALGAVEMLKTGCSAAYDLFMAVPLPTIEVFEAVVRAYQDVGLRAVVAPAVADMVFYQTVPFLMELLPQELREPLQEMKAAPTGAMLQLTEEGIRRWNGAADGRIRVGIAPTIPGQCSDEFLKGCVRLTREYGVGVHTHLVETKIQAVFGHRRWGETVPAHLAEIGLLNSKFVGAHGVWLTDEDIKILADHGANIAHNPASNLKLGSGIAPVRELLDAGVNVGLGCDGSMSSDNQNLFESMRVAALIGKIRFPHQAHRWVGSRDVWKMVTKGSARVLDATDETGELTPGKKADLTILKEASPFLRPLNDLLNALSYIETGEDVVTVIVDGRVVLDRGRVTTLDEDRLRARAQERAEQLREQNTEAWNFAETLTPFLAKATQKSVSLPFPVNRYAASL